MFTTTATASAQNFGQTDIPTIEVSGTADTYVTPNKIEISITINQADSKGKITMTELENSLAKALRDAGVDLPKQLVVTDQSSSTAKKQNAYQFKKYKLSLTNATEAAAVFENLAANGITNAQVMRVTHTDIKKLELEVKAEAVKNARENALALAGAIGQTIGEAIKIQDYNVMPVYNAVNIRGFASIKLEDTAGYISNDMPELQFQDIHIEQRISVTFRLK